MKVGAMQEFEQIIRHSQQTQDLEQAIRHQAVGWAELRFHLLVKRGQSVPTEWPGTLEEARGFVDELAGLAGQHLDDTQREPLALIVERRARTVWRQFQVRR